MKLSTSLKKYKDAEFSYGTLDCCLFAANVIKDITGTDFASKWRDRYSSKHGAMRMIAEHGSFEATVTSVLGPMLPMSEAKSGDPVLINHPQLVEQDDIGALLGICKGKQIVYLTEKGLESVPTIFGKGCFHE